MCYIVFDHFQNNEKDFVIKGMLECLKHINEKGFIQGIFLFQVLIKKFYLIWRNKLLNFLSSIHDYIFGRIFSYSEQAY